MGHIADTAFAAGPLHAHDAWFGVVGYAFQIYFDFSGYSDMAIGLALMMGFVLIQNFDSPYKSRQHHRVLAALAHQPVDLAARLPLHPARRQPQGPGAHLRQPDDRDAARRPVARRELELRHLGRHPRRHAGGRTRAGQAQPVPPAAAGRCGSAITFFVVCLSWVFFRAKTLDQAMVVPPIAVRPGAGRRGVRRRRRRALHAVPRRDVRARGAGRVGHAEHLGSSPSALSPAARRAGALALLALAMLLMWTQTTNPFLYFQF